jgi:hypothetical protein
MDDEDESWLFTGFFGSDPDVDLTSRPASRKWIPFVFIGLAALAIFTAIASIVYALIHK